MDPQHDHLSAAALCCAPGTIDFPPPLRSPACGVRRPEESCAPRFDLGVQACRRPCENSRWNRDLLMSSTFDTVAGIIAETCDIPVEKIKPESHAINDLGIDSLDFLDIAFAIAKAFGIKMPLEQWTQDVNDGNATTDHYFQLNNLCSRIDELVVAKSAA